MHEPNISGESHSSLHTPSPRSRAPRYDITRRGARYIPRSPPRRNDASVKGKQHGRWDEMRESEAISSREPVRQGLCYIATSPPRRNYHRKSKQKERWEEMNRREKMDREFFFATQETDHQIEELNRKKSREEQRRLQWDQDWESQSRATVSTDSMDVALTALSAATTSEESTAPGIPDIRSSKNGRGLAKFSGFLVRPFTKATETSRVSGQQKARKRMR